MPDTDPKHAAILRVICKMAIQARKQETVNRPQQLKVNATGSPADRFFLQAFRPGDVVEGGETGRLYLVIQDPHGERRVVHLDGPNCWRLGPTGGTFRAVEHAQLDIRRASR